MPDPVGHIYPTLAWVCHSHSQCWWYWYFFVVSETNSHTAIANYTQDRRDKTTKSIFVELRIKKNTVIGYRAVNYKISAYLVTVKIQYHASLSTTHLVNRKNRTIKLVYKLGVLLFHFWWRHLSSEM